MDEPRTGELYAPLGLYLLGDGPRIQVVLEPGFEGKHDVVMGCKDSCRAGPSPKFGQLVPILGKLLCILSPLVNRFCWPRQKSDLLPPHVSQLSLTHRHTRSRRHRPCLAIPPTPRSSCDGRRQKRRGRFRGATQVRTSSVASPPLAICLSCWRTATRAKCTWSWASELPAIQNKTFHTVQM